jgi:hypothetical protein
MVPTELLTDIVAFITWAPSSRPINRKRDLERFSQSPTFRGIVYRRLIKLHFRDR